MPEFADRRDAGARLALDLQGYAERPDVVVMALDVGGIPVGYELALRLGLELVLFDRDAIEKLVPEGTIIVAVDGVETTESIVPALQVLRGHGDVVAAIPVACANACSTLSTYVDDIVCLVTSPRDIESSYADFSLTTAKDAGQLLAYASKRWRQFSRHGTHRW